jgi:hypothetical protein
VVYYSSYYSKAYTTTETHVFETAYLTGTEYASKWYLIAPSAQKPILPLRDTVSKPHISTAKQIHHGDTKALSLQSNV